MLTARPSLLHFTRLRDAPGRAPEGDLYLYFASYPGIAKIGITTGLYGRLAVQQSRAKLKFESCYAVLLSAAEARRREHAIKRAFGERLPGNAMRFNEWFGRSHHALVLCLMTVPELIVATDVYCRIGDDSPRLKDLKYPEVRAIDDGFEMLRDGRTTRYDALGRRAA